MAAISVAAAAGPCPDSTGQRAAIEGYLTAMQEHRFSDAYDFVTTNMTDGRDRAEWAALQKQFFEGGEVKIYGIDVRSAHEVDGNSPCEVLAAVPNILRSSDKFNTDGIVEFEIYYVVNDGERWRIASQETIYGENAIGAWFPDVELVDVGTLN